MLPLLDLEEKKLNHSITKLQITQCAINDYINDNEADPSTS